MDEVDNFLEHFGVKGMKWGRRAKSSTPLAPQAAGYTPRMQKADFRRVGGAKGINKVNQKVADGKSLKSARESVTTERIQRNQKVAALVISGTYAALVLGPMIKEFGGIAVDSAVMAKKASNGRKAANNMFAESHGISSYPTIRLSQNPTTGNWV